MVIIKTSADEVRTQAVSPLSIRGSGGTAGAVAIAASGAPPNGVTSWPSAAAIEIVEARKRINIIALICCVTTNPLLVSPRSEGEVCLAVQTQRICHETYIVKLKIRLTFRAVCLNDKQFCCSAIKQLHSCEAFSLNSAVEK